MDTKIVEWKPKLHDGNKGSATEQMFVDCVVFGYLHFVEGSTFSYPIVFNLGDVNFNYRTFSE